MRPTRAGNSPCKRCVIVLTSTLAVALGAAAPAYASPGDEGESLASAVLGAAASVTEPAPQLSPDATPSAASDEPTATTEQGSAIDDLAEIATTVDADSGNLNVSVRVLSPGIDGLVTQEDAADAVISPAPSTDIAAGPTTAAAETSPDEQQTSSPTSVNTNVAVRVLSPGSNGPVVQAHETADVNATDALAEEAADATGDVEPTAAQDPSSTAELDASSQALPSDSEPTPSLSDDNSDGYHQDDSQYQSTDTSSPASWYWRWWFTIDCAGNPTTTSTETGTPASLDWTWEWLWAWSCTEPDDGSAQEATSSESSVSDPGVVSSPTVSSASGNTNVSVRVLSPGENGPVNQTTTGSPIPTGATTTGTAPAGEPWDWSWTFTFCDTTSALATQAASGTPLRWTWTWTWNWSCDAAVGEPPHLADSTEPEAVGSPAAAGDVISVPLPQEAFADVSAETFSDVPAPADSQPASSGATGELRLPGLSGALSTLTSLAGLDGPWVDVAVAIGATAGYPELPGPLLPQLSLPSASGAAGDVSVVVVVTEIPGATLPGMTSPRQAPSEPIGRRPTARVPAPAASTTAGSPVASGTTALPTTWQPRARGEIQAATKPTAERPTVRPTPRDRPRSLFSPLGELGSSRASGAAASGGLVPSAPVVAVAALTALFVLVAPGLGRRIRAARELSPRAAYRSSIDHPG
jgi:hypothetical protein